MSAPPLTWRRKRIEVLVAESEAGLRNHLRGALIGVGYGSVNGLGQSDNLVQALNSSLPDLVVLDMNLFARGRAMDIISELRGLNVGRNPFVPVIVTSGDASAPAVRAAINAGVDDFITKPYSPKQILDRIGLIVRARKPFIVTSDYIGPDRRKDPRGSTIQPFEVPNSLRDKEVEAVWDAETFLRSVETAKVEVNGEKARRTSFRLSFLVNLILSDFESGAIGAETLGNLNQLIAAINELQRRMPASQAGALNDTADLMRRLCQSVIGTPHEASRADLRLLPLLALTFMKATHPERGETDLAHEVAAAVSGYRERRRAQAEAAPDSKEA